jgi:galactose-1-phosphate uridylyltransferase
MNNLTQTQQDAKQSYLNNQREQMLDQYKNADANERGAIIKHIDSFLSIVPSDARIFWLKFREKLERLNEQTFPPVE